MPRPMDSSPKRARISIDVQPELRHRVRLAAAKRDLTIQQYLRQAIEARLDVDLPDDVTDEAMALTARTDPVLAELWDNSKDAEYDRL